MFKFTMVSCFLGLPTSDESTQGSTLSGRVVDLRSEHWLKINEPEVTGKNKIFKEVYKFIKEPG
jgi:hypothetical protein